MERNFCRQAFCFTIRILSYYQYIKEIHPKVKLTLGILSFFPLLHSQMKKLSMNEKNVLFQLTKVFLSRA